MQKQLLNATSVDDMKGTFLNATAAIDANDTNATASGEENEDVDEAIEK